MPGDDEQVIEQSTDKQPGGGKEKQPETINCGNSREMPRYKCHKQVWALKIKAIERMPEPPRDPGCESDGCGGGAKITPEDAGYGPFLVSAEYMRKHRPQAGGYYVVYGDGYKSFSPVKAFKEGYTRV